MNNTRATTMVEFRGVRQPLTPLCRQMGMPIGLVRLRLFKYGWSVERALTEPNNRVEAQAEIARRGNKRKSQSKPRIGSVNLDEKTDMKNLPKT